MSLTDALYELEAELAKYPGQTQDDLMNRRLVLRKAMTRWGDQRYTEGHTDGVRDMVDATYHAQQAARAAAEKTGPGDGR